MKKILVVTPIFLLALFGFFTYRNLNRSPKPQQVLSSSTTNPAKQTNYSFSATVDNTKAYDLLSSQAEVKTKDFGEAGLFVESINGLDADSSHYWAFYVNGTYAQKGISQTVLQKGDTIEFKYETITK